MRGSDPGLEALEGRVLGPPLLESAAQSVCLLFRFEPPLDVGEQLLGHGAIVRVMRPRLPTAGHARMDESLCCRQRWISSSSARTPSTYIFTCWTSRRTEVT